ncbi:hypothetical protein VTK56DRAFT_6706 [Thermocarpiscus australiensis]
MPTTRRSDVTKTVRETAQYRHSRSAAVNGRNALSEAAVEKALNEIFDRFAGGGGADELDIDAILTYTQALGIDMANYEFFVLADIVQVESLGQITRGGFVKGWKQVWETTGGEVAPDMDAHWKYVRSRIDLLRRDPEYFRKVYRSAFAAGKEPGKKIVNMNVALAYWEELFRPTLRSWRSANVDWLSAWKEYLAEKFYVEGKDGEEGKWTRAVSKDLWNQTVLFAAKTLEDESLSFWSEDQAWPGLIDEFVVWCRDRGIAAKSNGGMEVDK